MRNNLISRPIHAPLQSPWTVQSLCDLQGLSIPNPDADHGVMYFVVESFSYYALSLYSGAQFDACNVLPTVLGGCTRWLRLTITPSIDICCPTTSGTGQIGPTGPAGTPGATGATGPSTTSPIYIFGSIRADGTTLAGAGFTSARTSAGRYTITPTIAPIGDPQILAHPFQNGAATIISTHTFLAGVFNINTDIAGVATDAPFDFLVLTQP